MIYILLFLVIAAVVVVLFQVVGGDLFFRARAAKLKDRPDEHFNEIYDEYFKFSHLPKSAIEQVWEEAAFALRVPPRKLRPTDSFEKELKGYYSFFTLENLNEDLLLDMEYYNKEYEIERSKLKDAKTIGEYVLAVARAKTSCDDLKGA